MIKDLTPIIAIIAIAGLVGFAVFRGIDGLILSGGCSVIAALGGWAGKTARDRRRSSK